MLDTLEVLGLRGFATTQSIRFAKPNGEVGSGLTILVGSNNAGKSTVIEALRALVQRRAPSFTQGRRNRQAGDQVELRIVDVDGYETSLTTEVPGSSEMIRSGNLERFLGSRILIIPSRRAFNPYFGKGEATRDSYMNVLGFPDIRTSSFDEFSRRLFIAHKNREVFNKVLARVLDPVPQWTIDLMDTGQYFLKFTDQNKTHSSEGLGEGLISLFYIIDALYDSNEGETIVIDEPELSLHPALQRKLAVLLAEYATTRQIVLATHSPYFVSLGALKYGACITRVHISNGQSVVSQLSSETAQKIGGLLKNTNNPHILGINAQEVFFLEDKIVLVEGQEDVVYYERVQAVLGVYLPGNFFGWGVGGAENMELIATALCELGFSRIVGILDGNRDLLAVQLGRKFPDYHFFSIPAEDVRSKKEVKQKEAVEGLLDDNNVAVRPEYIEKTRELFNKAVEYLQSDKIS